MTINIDKLTIGDIKQIEAFFTNKININTASPAFSSAPTSNIIGASLVGEYVIVRSLNEGINAGFVEEMSSFGVVLKEARRLWFHRPLDKDQSWYEGIANTGLSDDSKISAALEEIKVIMEDYSLTKCTEIAKNSIRSFKSHAQQ